MTCDWKKVTTNKKTMFQALMDAQAREIHAERQRESNRRDDDAQNSNKDKSLINFLQNMHDQQQEPVGSRRAPFTEQMFKKWVEDNVKNGITVSLQTAMRRFKHYNIPRWRLNDLLDKYSDASSELKEIMDNSAGKANRVLLAEKIHNPINTINVPNEVHQADLLFLPHDDDDLEEIKNSQSMDIETFITGGSLPHETLAAHRRVYRGGSRQTKNSSTSKPNNQDAPSAPRLRPSPAPSLKARENMKQLVLEPNYDKPFKYCLTVVDIASRYKGAYPLRNKTAEDVYQGLWAIYNNSPLAWPSILQTDHGSEFVGLKKILRKPSTKIATAVHLEIPFYHLGFVENFNQKLTEKIFDAQREQELKKNETVRSWVNMLPSLLSDFNRIPQQALGGLTPSRAMAMPRVKQKPDGPPNTSNPLYHNWEKRYANKKFELGAIVRHYIPKDQYQNTDNDQRIIKDKGRRAGDPIWSVRKFRVIRVWRPRDMICDDDGKNCKKNKKSLWMHDLWPVDRPLPFNKGEWKPQNSPQYNHSEHFGFTRSFTFFQLKRVNKKNKGATKKDSYKPPQGSQSTHARSVVSHLKQNRRTYRQSSAQREAPKDAQATLSQKSSEKKLAKKGTTKRKLQHGPGASTKKKAKHDNISARTNRLHLGRRHTARASAPVQDNDRPSLTKVGKSGSRERRHRGAKEGPKVYKT